MTDTTNTTAAQAPTTPTYGAQEAGCWFDGARGIYIGCAIIAEAFSHGWDPQKDAPAEETPITELTDEELTDHECYHECYHELTDDAEEFMGKFAAEGYWFGMSEGGDWGLWACEEED